MALTLISVPAISGWVAGQTGASEQHPLPPTPPRKTARIRRFNLAGSKSPVYNIIVRERRELTCILSVRKRGAFSRGKCRARVPCTRRSYQETYNLKSFSRGIRPRVNPRPRVFIGAPVIKHFLPGFKIRRIKCPRPG